MFIIKYHKKGYKQKYLGEGLKQKYAELEKRENIKLQGICVSFVAETMYKNSIVKVSRIEW